MKKALKRSRYTLQKCNISFKIKETGPEGCMYQGENKLL